MYMQMYTARHQYPCTLLHTCAQLEDLKRDHQKMAATHASNEAELERLRSTTTSTSESAAADQNRAMEADKRYALLQQEHTAKINEWQAEKKVLEEAKASLTSQTSELTTRVAHFETEMATATAKMEAEIAARQEAEMKLQTVNQAHNKALTSALEQDSASAATGKRVLQLQTALNLEQQTAFKAKADLATLEKEHKSMRARAERDSDNMQRKLSEQTKQMSKVQQQSEAHRTEVARLQRVHSQHEAETSKRVAHLEKQLENARTRQSGQSGHAEQMSKDLVATNHRLQQAQQAAAKLEAKLRASNEELSEKNAALGELKTQEQKLREEVTSLTKHTSEMTTRTEAMKTAIDRLENSKKELKVG